MNIQSALKSPINVGVVIPSYRVTQHILALIEMIGPEVARIYVVDDKCPDNSGDFVEKHCSDMRVTVLRNPINTGVGGAVITGYKAAIEDGIDIIVKIDGDGQMDPSLIPQFIGPILDGLADYTKGNRFFSLDQIRSMPRVRIFGNAILSLITKLSSGYWDLFDPTNGYTAIHADVAKSLPLTKVSKRYFFESDLLFRLNIQRAVVLDVPMDAKYGNEVSHLKISSVIGEFLAKHLRNYCKRIFYNYYLRDLSMASIELPLGICLLASGATFGIWHWILSSRTQVFTPAGTVMLSALPMLMGLQLILAFLSYDIASVPKRPIHKRYLFKSNYADTN